MEKIEFRAEYLADDFYWRYVLGQKRPEELVEWLKGEGVEEEVAVELAGLVDKERARQGEANKKLKLEPIFSSHEQARRDFDLGR